MLVIVCRDLAYHEDGHEPVDRVRPQIITLAPWRAASAAQALPMPVPPPVTSTPWSSSKPPDRN